MGRRATSQDAQAAKRIAPAAPVQKRSRERFELILAAAETMLLETGGDAFKMSELVAKSGVPFGSLYQYFPDKTAVIAALADRYNKIGHACVSAALDPVADAEGLHSALIGIIDGYYDMYLDYPAMRAIWEATQADRVLLQIDREDGDYLGEMLSAALRRADPGRGEASADTVARLVMELIACAVRHAITLDKQEAGDSLTVFKRGVGGFLAAQSFVSRG